MQRLIILKQLGKILGVRIYPILRYLMRMRIQVTKMMRIHAYPDPDADPDLQHWFRKNLN